jgi:hypothetical protein
MLTGLNPVKPRAPARGRRAQSGRARVNTGQRRARRPGGRQFQKSFRKGFDKGRGLGVHPRPAAQGTARTAATRWGMGPNRDPCATARHRHPRATVRPVPAGRLFDIVGSEKGMRGRRSLRRSGCFRPFGSGYPGAWLIAGALIRTRHLLVKAYMTLVGSGHPIGWTCAGWRFWSLIGMGRST